MKSKPLLPFGVALCSLFAVVIPVFAQGNAFTYQGRLTNGTNFANGIYDLRFGLFNAVSSGTQIGPSLTNAALAVSNGFFTVTLDFANGAFPGADRWLEIGVRTNGSGAFTTLTPRQKITPSPYAITASNLTGTVSGGGLAGTYSGAVTFSNAANSFTGSGAGLSALNANNLSTGTVPSAALNNAWKTTGNAGTTPGPHFLGTTDNRALEFKVSGLRALRMESNTNFFEAAPNLIGGAPVNFVHPNVIGAFIGGGGSVSPFSSAFSNQIASSHAVIVGGNENVIETNSIYSAIGGGLQNRIQLGGSSVIAGGRQNMITNAGTVFIGGGWANRIRDAEASAIVGGLQNTITNGGRSFIGGGDENAIGDSLWSAIAGGFRNTITSGDRGFIGAGNQNTILDGSHSLIGGGTFNRILSQNGGFIGGGVLNQLGGDAFGGSSTIVTNSHNAIAGGVLNLITTGALGSFIGGGRHNSVTNGAHFATIPGGRENVAGGDYAFAAGRKAKARHDGTFVWADSIDSDFSSSDTNQFLIRAGGGVGINVTNPVDALHVQSATSVRTRTTTTGTGYAGYLSENSLGEWFAGVPNATNYWYLFENAPVSGARLVVRSGGNVGIGTTNPTNKLHVIGGATFSSGAGGANQSVVWAPGSASWSFTSDRNAKEDIAPVDPGEVLEKLARVPVAEWNYIGYPQRHIGPMAQDFHAQFPLSGDDKSLNDADLHGVALAAIQGLNQKLQQKETEITELQQRLETLERIIRNQKSN